MVEGSRLVAAALEHTGRVETVFVDVDATPSAASVAAAARDRGLAVEELAPGVAKRVGDTVTSQGVFAVASFEPQTRDVLVDATFVVIVDRVNDPGNAGTLWRSAAAAGADVFVLGPGSVDAYNPKLVRATAGAAFKVPVLEHVDIASVLDECGARGVLRVGAVVRDGAAPETVDFTAPCALVLGHEARGLDAALPV
ncbi:MAG: methyltransferase, TrmH family, partial [Actinomycetota bacterium]|nr:methyltransferase, TrmH family [Actinomycetota bacterium]